MRLVDVRRVDAEPELDERQKLLDRRDVGGGVAGEHADQLGELEHVLPAQRLALELAQEELLALHAAPVGESVVAVAHEQGDVVEFGELADQHFLHHGASAHGGNPGRGHRLLP